MALSKVGNALLPTPTAYLVAYQLSWPEEQYLGLIRELRESPAWWHWFPSVWIVLRRETLVDLAQILRQLILASDRLVVMPAKGPADGILPAAAWNWLNHFVPREW